MEERSIAVIGGTGDQGFGLVLRWAAAGRRVVIGSRDAARAAAAAGEARVRLGETAAPIEGRTNQEAAGAAALVVLAVPFSAQMATLKSITPALASGTILVDLTVPLEASVGGSPARVLGLWAGSAAQQAAAQVPAGVEVAAAFHNISAQALRSLDKRVECDVLVCADRVETRQALRPWVEAIPGCRYVDAGPLENARVVEAITALLIGINRRYKVHMAGLRITGLEERPEGSRP
jgi:NADPH-dependent F420 reductase